MADLISALEFLGVQVVSKADSTELNLVLSANSDATVLVSVSGDRVPSLVLVDVDTLDIRLRIDVICAAGEPCRGHPI